MKMKRVKVQENQHQQTHHVADASKCLTILILFKSTSHMKITNKRPYSVNDQSQNDNFNFNKHKDISDNIAIFYLIFN